MILADEHKFIRFDTHTPSSSKSSYKRQMHFLFISQINKQTRKCKNVFMHVHKHSYLLGLFSPDCLKNKTHFMLFSFILHYHLV